MINADVIALLVANNGFVAESTSLRSKQDVEEYFRSPKPDLRLM